MNIANLLVSQASVRPDAMAIIADHGNRTHRMSFAELDGHSASCAGFLADAGVTAGDRVLMLVPMAIELYVAMIAVFRLGAVATFLDPSAGAEHINACCDAVTPAALIAVSKAHLLGLKSGALRRIRFKFSIGWPVPGARRWENARRFAAKPSIVSRATEDPALITFTSGSTGQPKAAVRSHGFLAAQHHSLQRAIHLKPGEIDLATLPIFSLANLASGVTTVVPDADLRRPGFIDPAPVLRQVARHQITRSTASPAFFERLLSGSEVSAAMSTMRHVYTGGAPVLPGLMSRLQRALPQAQIVAVYGSTEAEPIAHVAFADISKEDAEAMFAGAGLLAGPPVADIDLRIIMDQWGRPIRPMTPPQLDQASLPAKQPGEIVVHGDHVLTTYLHGRGDEQTKFRVGDQIWHRTGDAGYLDQRGRLWLLGRAEAKIDSDLGVLYPFSVECAASRIEGVRRTAMLLHDRRRCLVIEPSGDDRAAVEVRLRERLAWAHIEEFRIVPAIPLDKRHNAKIDYPALRAMLNSPA